MALMVWLGEGRSRELQWCSHTPSSMQNITREKKGWGKCKRSQPEKMCLNERQKKILSLEELKPKSLVLAQSGGSHVSKLGAEEAFGAV